MSSSSNLFKKTDEKEHPPHLVIRRSKAASIWHRRGDLFRKLRENSQYKANFEENWTLQKKVISLKGCPFFKRIEGCSNEVVHLSVPNPENGRLVWIFNHFRFPGPYTTKNCLKVIVTPHTVGMYVCFRVKGDFEEVECVIVRIVNQLQKKIGPTQEPGLSSRGLLLMPDGLCSDVDRDGGGPKLCRTCQIRGTVFDTPINRPIFVGGKANEPRMLQIRICDYCAIKQFRLVWIHHLDEYPTNSQSLQIRIADSTVGQWYCMAVFVGDSQFQYCSRPFMVHLEEESQEETPLRPPSQQQQVTTRSSLSGDCQRVSKRSPPVGGYEFEIVRGLQAQHDPSRADSQSTVSGCTVSGYLKKLHDALRRYLDQFLHRDFRFDYLIRRDSLCHEEIKKILSKLMDKGLADAEFVEELFKTLTWDDTMEPLTEVRQCDQLVYRLIWGLLDQCGPRFHRELAYSLVEHLPLPPYVYCWNPSHGCHTYPSKSRVTLSVFALNADHLEWRHNGIPVCSKDTSTLYHSELQHTITVCEETCGIYSCVAYNNRNDLTSQSPAITVNVDYGLASFAPLGTIRQTPTLHEGLVLTPPPPISPQPNSPMIVPQNPEDNDIGKLCTGREFPKPINKLSWEK